MATRVEIIHPSDRHQLIQPKRNQKDKYYNKLRIIMISSPCKLLQAKVTTWEVMVLWPNPKVKFRAGRQVTTSTGSWSIRRLRTWIRPSTASSSATLTSRRLRSPNTSAPRSNSRRTTTRSSRASTNRGSRRCSGKSSSTRRGCSASSHSLSYLTIRTLQWALRAAREWGANLTPAIAEGPMGRATLCRSLRRWLRKARQASMSRMLPKVMLAELWPAPPKRDWNRSSKIINQYFLNDLYNDGVRRYGRRWNIFHGGGPH